MPFLKASGGSNVQLPIMTSVISQLVLWLLYKNLLDFKDG